MKLIFADTFYWIALINPRDNWHFIALNYAQKYTDDYLITTDGIVDETLNYFATKGAIMRRKALATYFQIRQEPNMEIISYTPQLRQAGIQLFDERPDKGYSLTDCISMIVMKQRRIAEVLTHDKHFTQENFRILFQDSNFNNLTWNLIAQSSISLLISTKSGIVRKFIKHNGDRYNSEYLPSPKLPTPLTSNEKRHLK